MVGQVLQLRQLSDWQPGEPQQTAMARFIADGHLGRHLRRTRKIYTGRHRLVTEFLADAAERGSIGGFMPTCAGLHVMAMLPSGTDEQQICAAAEGAGVAVGALAPSWQGADPPPGLIVGFGSIGTDQLPDALAHLSSSAL
jgi:GntR family transcriptional regulator/MocR family aminotransferase